MSHNRAERNLKPFFKLQIEAKFVSIESGPCHGVDQRRLAGVGHADHARPQRPVARPAHLGPVGVGELPFVRLGVSVVDGIGRDTGRTWRVFNSPISFLDLCFAF